MTKRQLARWSAAEKAFLREHYPWIANERLAEHSGRSVRSLTSAATRLGVKKCHERLGEMGRENQAGRRPPELHTEPNAA